MKNLQLTLDTPEIIPYKDYQKLPRQHQLTLMREWITEYPTDYLAVKMVCETNDITNEIEKYNLQTYRKIRPSKRKYKLNGDKKLTLEKAYILIKNNNPLDADVFFNLNIESQLKVYHFAVLLYKGTTKYLFHKYLNMPKVDYLRNLQQRTSYRSVQSSCKKYLQQVNRLEKQKEKEGEIMNQLKENNIENSKPKQIIQSPPIEAPQKYDEVIFTKNETEQSTSNVQSKQSPAKAPTRQYDDIVLKVAEKPQPTFHVPNETTKERTTPKQNDESMHKFMHKEEVQQTPKTATKTQEEPHKITLPNTVESSLDITTREFSLQLESLQNRRGFIKMLRKLCRDIRRALPNKSCVVSIKLKEIDDTQNKK